MARAKTKEAKPKIAKRERPSLVEESADYRIENMRRHLNFYVAEIYAPGDEANRITVHTRYGAWFAGDPNARGAAMKEPITAVRFALQQHLKRFQASEPDPGSNPFMALATPTPPANPFMNL